MRLESPDVSSAFNSTSSTEPNVVVYTDKILRRFNAMPTTKKNLKSIFVYSKRIDYSTLLF